MHAQIKRIVSRIACLVLVASIVVGPISVSRAGEGWGLLPWNPFGSSSKSGTTKSKSAPKAAAKKTPSTWTQISRKTSSVLSDTKHTVMPWTKPDPSKRAQAPLTGSRTPSKSSTARNSASKAKSEGSWMSWLWGEEEKPQRPLTVSDWIIQPKPE